MPKMDGYTMAFNLRRELNTRFIPIHFLAPPTSLLKIKSLPWAWGLSVFLKNCRQPRISC